MPSYSKAVGAGFSTGPGRTTSRGSRSFTTGPGRTGRRSFGSGTRITRNSSSHGILGEPTSSAEGVLRRGLVRMS